MGMADTVRILDVMDDLTKACHKNSVDHGFWNEEERVFPRVNTDHVVTLEQRVKTKPWNFGEKIALIHSELSEALEAHRKGNPPSNHDVRVIDPQHSTAKNPIGTRRVTGVEEELADAMIRMLDLCGKLEIDIGRVILAKMAYNAGRPMKHGRAY